MTDIVARLRAAANDPECLAIDDSDIFRDALDEIEQLRHDRRQTARPQTQVSYAEQRQPLESVGLGADPILRLPLAPVDRCGRGNGRDSEMHARISDASRYL